MPTVEYPTNPNTDTAFVTDDGGKRTRSLKTVLVDGTIDYPKNANVKDCYVTIDGKKQRALMTADVSKDGVVEYPDGSNSTKGYVTVDGKKHRVVLTATLAGGAPDPVIAELNVTPTTSAQTITAPEGTDGYSPVKVSAVTSSIDANIQAGNIKKDVTILGVTGTLEGSSGKYKLLQRVKDDSDNDIGCVVGFRRDSSNNEYAVVCLNKAYRNSNNYALCSKSISVSGIPVYSNSSVYDAPETATKNCDEIIITATSQSATTAAITECRNYSFIINGITYYGQLPSLTELLLVLMYRTIINTNDPSVSGQEIDTSFAYWSSTQGASNTQWFILNGNGRTGNTDKFLSYHVTPILEIPNA